MHKRLCIRCTNLPQLPGRRMQSGTVPITLNDTDMKSGKIMVIGSSNTDMTVFTQRHPEPGETVLGGHFRMGAGGKGANQAVAARRLGGDVSFVCKVGPDLFGDNAIRHYRDEGLDVSGVMRSDSPSGVALITVDASGENSIVVASGANADITVEDIESIRGQIEQASILLLQLEIPVPAVSRAAEIAHRAGVYVILNPAPACSLPEDIFDCISLIIPNRTEMHMLTGYEPSDAESADAAFKKMHSMGIRDIILTLGSEGCIVDQQDRSERIAIPARKVKAVDTTGAGDTFCGALCVALSEGGNLVEAAEFATCAAALAVQRPGAQESAPCRSDVMSMCGGGRA